MSYKFLLDLAIILLSTKLLGLVTRRIHMPQVVGALLAGLILGPVGFNILQETDFIKMLAELGVVILMFTAGLDTNLVNLKKSGKASLIIAIIGVIVPLLGGFLVAAAFNGFNNMTQAKVVENIFVGVILTATSVSITVETLKELGKLSTKVSDAILGAALIDDVIGIIVLTIATSIADPSVNIAIILLKIFGFFALSFVVGILSYKIFKYWFSRQQKEVRRISIAALVYCLVFAYVAEHFFGIADITGAFIAGLILSQTMHHEYIAKRVDVLSYLLLSPIFFASIGISVVLPQMNLNIIMFTIALLLVAILSKVVGCFIGAKITKFNNADSLRIGIGMVSRGEVALIVLSKGNELGIINPNYAGPVIIIIVLTTILAPIFLKLAYKNDKNELILKQE